jgi:DNA-binding LytR/AlgR family response regulator
MLPFPSGIGCRPRVKGQSRERVVGNPVLSDAAIERVRHRMLVRRAAEEGTTPRGGCSRRQYLHRLVTRVGQHDVIIPINAIDYIEADDVYATVIAHPKRHRIRTSLDALERSLDSRLFLRVHRSYTVRIACVSAVRHRPGNRAETVMSCGAVLPSVTAAGRR